MFKNNKYWLQACTWIGYPVVFILTLVSTFSIDQAKASVSGAEGAHAAFEWGDSLVVAFVLAMVIRSFLFQPFVIPSGSMRPTLIEGDRLFVNKLAYGPLIPLSQVRIPGFTVPKRGDVVVFRFPVTRDKDFIKRLIAVGGETVEIRNGQVVINGEPVRQGPVGGIHYYNMGEYGAAGKVITVPKGYYFVMGDNSGASHDSRFWGFVPEALVIGRAEGLFWPLNRIRWIK